MTIAGTGPAEEEFSLPYRGERLRGDDLARRLDAWVTAGIIEPSCAEAVRGVTAHPEWLRLPGRTVAVLGAGSEIGPLPVLLRWGATVAGLDLPQPRIWERVLQAARDGAGTLHVPVRSGAGLGRGRAGAGRRAGPDGGIADRAGADLAAEVPEIADWLAGLDGSLVIGNYVYADGAANVRVCAAADTLTLRLQAAGTMSRWPSWRRRPTSSRSRLTRSPSPHGPMRRPLAVKLAGRPLRTLSGGRLLRRAYRPDADPGINDSLVAQQGPNYALAKRLQRWRASVARDSGSTVSLNVAPPTRTRSVVKNRALAAAYAGAHRFGAEVFDPDTTRVLMAALLVHDLNTGGGPVHAHPWQDEAYAAAHGGLWRIAWAPRSALGLAALLGYGAART